MRTITEKFHLASLDGLRAVSITLVLLAHLAPTLFSETGIVPSGVLLRAFAQGSFGVVIFFGISGFLITGRLLKEEADFGDVSLKEFYIRRIFRILPVFLLFLLAIPALKLFFGLPVKNKEILYSLFFARNYLPASDSSWWLSHFWSLSVEEHYYLLFPVLFVILPRRFRPHWIFALCAVIFSWRFYYYHSPLKETFLPHITERWRSDLVIDYILWGSLTAVLYREKALHFLDRGFIPVASFLLLLGTLYVDFPLKTTLQTVILQILIYSAVLTRTPVLNQTWIRTAGTYSYSLYIWQQLFLWKPESRFPSGAPDWLGFFPFNILFLMAVSYASFNFCETKIIRWSKRFLERRI